MKAHIGVAAHSGLVHTAIGTAGHVSDISQMPALLHGDETDAFGDAGYQGIDKREEHLETPVTWHVAMRPGKRRALDKLPEAEQQEWLEQAKASIRAKVEHPFRGEEPVPPSQKLTIYGSAPQIISPGCLKFGVVQCFLKVLFT